MRNSLIMAAAGSAALLAVVAVTGPGAQAGDPYHIRGKLAAVGGSDLTIDRDDGTTVSVTLNEDALVFIVEGATINDIRRGQFVGITSIFSQGQRVALEVHIFEETLRGLAEGHYPWDLVGEENMMTNAGIAKLVDIGDDRRLTVTYVEGEPTTRSVGTQTIVVPPEAIVVNFYATGHDKLIVGETVFLIAVDTDDGAVASPAIVVGQNGMEPPM
jgi:hypothetical protein